MHQVFAIPCPKWRRFAFCGSFDKVPYLLYLNYGAINNGSLRFYLVPFDFIMPPDASARVYILIIYGFFRQCFLRVFKNNCCLGIYSVSLNLVWWNVRLLSFSIYTYNSKKKLSPNCDHHVHLNHSKSINIFHLIVFIVFICM